MMPSATVDATVETLQLLGEPTRMRLLALLARQELSVAEMTAILDLPQSRISTHLGRLREAGVVRDRKAGASTYYALNDGAMPAGARKVWALLEAELDDDLLARDRERCDALLGARRQAAAWPDAVAGEMERHYSPGRTWESLARGLVGLVRLGDVLDGGAGDGTVAQLLAPRARSWVCVDRSERLVQAARRRLARQANAICQVGDLHRLPFGDASFDQVLLFHVLASVDDPPVVLAEAARVLRPGGALVVLTLREHDRLDVTAAYHHVHPGFAPAALRRLLARAGMQVQTCDVVSRERREPHFEVVAAFAAKRGGS